MNKIIKRLLIIGVPLLVVVSLVAGLALPALADTEATKKPVPPPNMVKGKVVSVAADKLSFVIKPGNQAEMTIKVDQNTKYYLIQRPIKVQPVPGNQPAQQNAAGIKEKVTALRDRVEATVREKLQGNAANAQRDVQRGLGNKNGQDDEEEVTETDAITPEESELVQSLLDEEQAQGLGKIKQWINRFNFLRQNAQKATFDNIAVGDTVIVRLMPNENLAKLVLIIKAPATTANRVHGIITAISSNSITITPTGGTAVVLGWDGNTTFVLKGLIQVQVGQTATAVYSVAADGTKKAKTVNVSLTPAPTPTTTSTSGTI